MFDKSIEVKAEPTFFRTQPKENWKFVVFNDGSSEQIDGEDYWYKSFINSDKFIIHDVTTILTGDRRYMSTTYHIWYGVK